MSYDITENKSDLHLLEDVEANRIVDEGEFFMENTFALMDCTPARCINEEDFEIEVLEIVQKGVTVVVSMYDVEAMARHFGIISGE